MKRIIASLTAVILIALAIAACSDNMSTETPSTTGTSLKGTGKTENFCVNNGFPSYSFGETYPVGIDYCYQGNAYVISAYLGAQYWSQLISDPSSGILLGYPCDPNEGIKRISSVQKLQEGNYPKLTWAFVYSHTYVVQRKIDNGSYTTIATISNKKYTTDYDYSAGPYASYVDNAINLSAPHGTVTYRVYVGIYDHLSSASPEVVYASNMPVAAAISGPNWCCIPAKGEPSVTYTWTANVTGGTAPYTYDWQWQGLSMSTASSYSRTLSYYAANTSVKTLTLVVTDAVGAAYTTTKSVTVATASDCLY
jgi:hypothetical protein